MVKEHGLISYNTIHNKKTIKKNNNNNKNNVQSNYYVNYNQTTLY